MESAEGSGRCLSLSCLMSLSLKTRRPGTHRCSLQVRGKREGGKGRRKGCKGREEREKESKEREKNRKQREISEWAQTEMD